MARDELLKLIQSNNKVIWYLLERSFVLDEIREKFVQNKDKLCKSLNITDKLTIESIKEDISDSIYYTEDTRPTASDVIINHRIKNDRENEEHFHEINLYYHRIKNDFLYSHLTRED